MASGWFLLVFLVSIFLMSYFLMIRPMRQREKAHDRLVEGIGPGDTVITAGGVFGEVDTIDEDSVVLVVESGAKIRVTKGAVVGRPGSAAHRTEAEVSR